jgi:hypothetical protein
MSQLQRCTGNNASATLQRSSPFLLMSHLQRCTGNNAPATFHLQRCTTAHLLLMSHLQRCTGNNVPATLHSLHAILS